MPIRKFELERYAERYEYDVPFLLGCSDSESFTIDELLRLEPDSAEMLGQVWLGYTEFHGSLQLRTSIADLYTQIAPEQVMVHCGGEEAIYNFMNAALEPGHHFIVHYPAYQSLYEIAVHRGCELTRWTTRYEDGWELDLNSLRRHLRPNTRAVVINCPHNPTGYMISSGKMRELVELSREHGFIIFSDEVYRLLDHDGPPQVASACDLDDRAVSLNVMSKSFGLGGLRIGWIATRNRELFERMSIFKDYTTICNNAPGEFLAELALRHKTQLLNRNREIIRRNMTFLEKFFADHSDCFAWVAPRSGSIGFPVLRHGGNAEAFCDDLRSRAGVLLLPGHVYGTEYGSHFRLGFGRRNVPECLARVATHLKSVRMNPS